VSVNRLKQIRMVVRSVGWNEEMKLGDKIFASWTPDQVTVSFGRICRELKIADFRFHDLRLTAASWLRMSGADIHTVAQLLGHKDLRMAARYQHPSPAFLQEAVGKLDAVFGSLSTENGGECYQDITGNLALGMEWL
jgi:integrase